MTKANLVVIGNASAFSLIHRPAQHGSESMHEVLVIIVSAGFMHAFFICQRGDPGKIAGFQILITQL